MKKSKSILSLLVFTLLYSCEPDVYFDSAMPPDVSPITEIPNNLLGAFLCDSDNDVIYVENRLIYMMSYDQFITTIDEINQTESCNLLNGELFLPNREDCVPFEYLNEDKIRVTLSSIDTLFAFRKDEVAKMYKNRLFLNVKGEIEDEWITYMITEKDHGILLWERIEVPDEKEYLKSLTNDYQTIAYQETDDKYIISPTLIEFDDFLEKEFTLECDVLIPINAKFKN